MIAIPNDFPIPLHMDDNGKIRVGDTRVLLELVIHAYLQGETAESIVDSYSTLKLSDVYAVLAYYLENHAEVDAYVRKAEEQVDQIQQQVEADYSPETRAFRARLHTLAQTRKSTG
jgi:uncharacterized protein (DUF433 family)